MNAPVLGSSTELGGFGNQDDGRVSLFEEEQIEEEGKEAHDSHDPVDPV